MTRQCFQTFSSFVYVLICLLCSGNLTSSDSNQSNSNHFVFLVLELVTLSNELFEFISLIENDWCH